MNAASPATNVLDELFAWLRRYVRTSSDHDLWLLTLWIAHTHLIGQCRTTPRLLITSPLPGAGKTTTLEHVQALARRPALASNALSASALANLAREQRTILIDEADKHIGSGSEAQRAALGIVNAGYKSSGTYAVNVADDREPTGWRVAEVAVFGPLAMAGISPDLPPDTLSRCVTVWLLPDVGETVHESDWELIECDAEDLRARLSSWGDRVELATGETLPGGISGRLREVWRPLKRVAVAAGGNWPARCDELARRHLAEISAQRDSGLIAERPHIVVSRDLFGVWHLADPDNSGFAATSDLLTLLHQHAPTTWGLGQGLGRTPLNAKRLAAMLAKHFGIHPTRRRVGDDSDQRRGYLWADLEPVWTALGLITSGHQAESLRD